MERSGSEVTLGLLARVSTSTWEQDGDLSQRHHSASTSTWALLSLSWSALGVIYGDILTSPLYVMTGIFESKHGVKPTHAEVVGVTSLVIWTIAALVVVKYALIVLRADDNGNGGTFALFSLLRRAINLQFDVSGPNLPSDYRLSRYSTTPTAAHTEPQHAQHAYHPPTMVGNSGGGFDGTLYVTGGTSSYGRGGGQQQTHDNDVEHGKRQGTHTMHDDVQGANHHHHNDNNSHHNNGTSHAATKNGHGQAGVGHGQRSGRDWRRELGKSFYLRKCISIMVATGVGFILGDGTITPAISVLSAVEGLKGVVDGIHRPEIVGITVAILVCLFTIQRYGTSTVSIIFAPVICAWLLLNAGIGVHNIMTYHVPIIHALHPGAWISLARATPVDTWHKLSGVLLCVTGTEALFADLAHFSRPAIQLSCIGLVFPALVLTYLGQGAYLAAHPHHAGTLYWHSIPKPLYWPMLVLATLATITASQALISAVFSVVSQAMSQGFFPKFRVQHTSRHVHGQIYIPVVNTIMMMLTVAVVLVFRESKRLGAAYGIAVCCDMLLTTIFTALVMCLVWRMALIPVVFLLVFGVIEGLFMSASLSKILHGGWLTLMMAAVWGLTMWTWNWGTVKKIKYTEAHSKRLRDVIKQQVRLGDEELVERLTLVTTGENIQRYNGVGFFYCDTIRGLPPSLCTLFEKVPALPRVVVIVTNRRVPIPDVLQEERFLIEPLALSGFYHVVVRYGYMEEINQGGQFGQQLLEHLRSLLVRSKELRRKAMLLHSSPTRLLPTRTDSHASAQQQLLSTSAPSTSFTQLPVGAGDTHTVNALPGDTHTDSSICQQSTCSQTSPAAPHTAAAAAGGHGGHGGGGNNDIEQQSSCGALGRFGPRVHSMHSMRSMDSLTQATVSTAQPSALVSRTSTPSLTDGLSERGALWRSLSDSILLSEAPFMAEEQAPLFMPTGGPGGGAGPSGRRFMEEEAIRIKALEQELETIRRNAGVRMTCFFGKTVVRARPNSPLWRWLMLEYAYQVLVNNFTLSSYESFGLPLEKVVEVAQVYKL